MIFTLSQQRLLRMFALFCGVYFNGVWMAKTSTRLDDISYVILVSFAIHLAFTYSS